MKDVVETILVYILAGIMMLFNVVLCSLPLIIAGYVLYLLLR